MTVVPRQSKYCSAIEVALRELSHATNAELLAVLRRQFPTLSATTVHRATARLAGRGEIAVAPPNASGDIRYDTNLAAHDHFVCSGCDELRDIDIASDVLQLVARELRNCHVSGRITITGTCSNCNKGEK